MADDYEQVTVESREQWHSWLAEHHATAPGVWLVTYKKGTGRPRVPYDDIVTEAIAFGWVDSRPRRLDDARSQLLVTPRKPSSKWSRANKQRVRRLLAEGRMAPAGIAAVAAARANGAWTALDEVEELREPDDLRAALDAVPAARHSWDAFPPSTKRAILEWIAAAKKRTTREGRINETARLAAQNIRANQWRRPGSSTSTNS